MDYDVVGVAVLLFVTTDFVQLVISAMVIISSDFHAPHHCRCFDDHYYDYVSVWQHYVTLSVSFYHYYHAMSTYSYSVQQYDYYHGYDDVGCSTCAVEHGQSNRLRMILLDDLLDERRYEQTTFVVGLLATTNFPIIERQCQMCPLARRKTLCYSPHRQAKQGLGHFTYSIQPKERACGT
jgi:hypothetical protein